MNLDDIAVWGSLWLILVVVAVVSYFIGRYNGTWNTRFEVLVYLNTLGKNANDRAGRWSSPSGRFHRMLVVKRLTEMLEERWNHHG